MTAQVRDTLALKGWRALPENAFEQHTAAQAYRSQLQKYHRATVPIMSGGLGQDRIWCNLACTSESRWSQGGDYQKYMDYSKYTQGAQGGSQAGSKCAKALGFFLGASLERSSRKESQLALQSETMVRNGPDSRLHA